MEKNIYHYEQITENKHISNLIGFLFVCLFDIGILPLLCYCFPYNSIWEPDCKYFHSPSYRQVACQYEHLARLSPSFYFTCQSSLGSSTFLYHTYMHCKKIEVKTTQNFDSKRLVSQNDFVS